MCVYVIQNSTYNKCITIICQSQSMWSDVISGDHYEGQFVTASYQNCQRDGPAIVHWWHHLKSTGAQQQLWNCSAVSQAALTSTWLHGKNLNGISALVNVTLFSRVCSCFGTILSGKKLHKVKNGEIKKCQPEKQVQLSPAQWGTPPPPPSWKSRKKQLDTASCGEGAAEPNHSDQQQEVGRSYLVDVDDRHD